MAPALCPAAGFTDRRGGASDVIASAPNTKTAIVPFPHDLVAAWLRELSIAQAAETFRDVLATFLGWQQDVDYRVLYKDRDLEEESSWRGFFEALRDGKQPCMVRILFRLLGGKGGFGALLRGQKGGKKTTDFDSCRDLTGRRLRHSKAVERITEWMKKKTKDEELARASQGEGPELPKLKPESELLDPKFIETLKRNASDRSAAVGEGMKALWDRDEEEPAAKRLRVSEETASTTSSSTATAATIAGSLGRETKAGNATEIKDRPARAVFGALDPLGTISSPSEDSDEESDGS